MFEIESFRNDGTASPAKRAEVAHCLDVIADAIWVKDPGYWATDKGLFSPETKVNIARRDGAPVGFVVYKRAEFGDDAIICVGALNVLPEYQGRGLFEALCRPALMEEMQAGGHRLFLAARTRNPIVWTIAAKWAQNLVPPVDGAAPSTEMLELAKAGATILFPDHKLDVPAMILREAYAAFRYHAPQRHRDDEINERVFGNTALGPDDALFLFGRLR